MSDIYYYGLHHILTIDSTVLLPELEMFRVPKFTGKATIQIRVGKPKPKPASAKKPTERYHFYKELFWHLGFEIEIDIEKKITIVVSPLLRISPHVLYTNVVEPVLRWAFVERGYALVHGATIAFGDQAYMITARTDTGKTTTLLKILGHQRNFTDNASFISDDMTLVSPDGTALTFPKPLTISQHTLQAVDPTVLSWRENLALFFQSRIHSREGRRIAFFLGKTRLPMATVNALVQLLVPPPKYSVERLVPGVKMTSKAKLAGLFIIERGEDQDVMLESDEAIEILLKNCEDAYGFPPYGAIKEFLYMTHSKDLRLVEQVIIRKALMGLPANLIRSSHLEWWRRIPLFVNDTAPKGLIRAKQHVYNPVPSRAIKY
jgi:dolichol-phosphate mannosyltransferase